MGWGSTVASSSRPGAVAVKAASGIDYTPTAAQGTSIGATSPAQVKSTDTRPKTTPTSTKAGKLYQQAAGFSSNDAAGNDLKKGVVDKQGKAGNDLEKGVVNQQQQDTVTSTVTNWITLTVVESVTCKDAACATPAKRHLGMHVRGLSPR